MVEGGNIFDPHGWVQNLTRKKVNWQKFSRFWCRSCRSYTKKQLVADFAILHSISISNTICVLLIYWTIVVSRPPGEFQRTKKKKNFFRIFQLRTWKITVCALISVNFHVSFWNVARTFIALKSWTSPIWRFCLVKYAHNGPLNEVINFGIPGFIFQA